MQLVAYGAQDIYLTGQPQITFFKSVYRRHTNFAMESIEQTIQGNPSAGARVTVTVARDGDLITNAYLEFPPVGGYTGGALAANFSPNSYENFNVFDNVELEIGGQLVDRIHGDWAIVWSELVFRKGYVGGPLAAPGSILLSDVMCNDTLATVVNNAKLTGGMVQIPLQFWFQDNPGLAIPLIALQYHDVRFIIQYSNDATLCNAGNNGCPNFFSSTVNAAPVVGGVAMDATIASGRFFINYVYLDTTERRRFAQNAHEYLITQHQRLHNNITVANFQQLLNFNHPVKYLMWRTCTPTGAAGESPQSELQCDAYSTARITLNGTDRFQTRDGTYFETEQVFDYWPCGGNQLTSAYYHSNREGSKWSLYSFAARPAEHQPSGTLNFSRIDNAQLVITGALSAPGTPSTDLFVHAENYNVLRIMSGMGGLAYSN